MSWQVYSDLHLEFHKKKIPVIIPEANNLILAGDITTPHHITKLDTLLKYCSENWTHIYYICGNHEFYHGGDMIKLKENYREICNKYTNVHFLDSSYIIVNGVVIYGFIGWTPLNKYIIKEGWENLCDFQLIKIGTSHMTPKMMVKMSNDELEKFDIFLHKVNSGEILCESVIVITHFPPVRENTSAPKYRGNELQPYFSWHNIMENRSCPKLKVWVSAHTHWSYNFILNGIRYISNQMGYPGENVTFNNGLFSLND